MQTACDASPSGLLSVFLTHKSELKTMLTAAEEWCTKKLRLDVPVVCTVANYLTPEVKVIGGNAEVCLLNIHIMKLCIYYERL